MQGRIALALAFVWIPLTACSPKELLKADCHSCTVEEHVWKEFSWTELSGRWKGSVETLKNEKGVAKRQKTDRRAELQFLSGADFLKAKGSTCQAVPSEALVLNGLLWEQGGSATREFETFVPGEDGKAVYGRLSFEKMNGQELCHFRRLGRVMGKNRLNLPSVSFSDHATVSGGGRMPASVPLEQDISVEFLRFAPREKLKGTFQADGRRPASVVEQERPPLILRVFKVSAKMGTGRGEWNGTEEQIYRLWKVE